MLAFVAAVAAATIETVSIRVVGKEYGREGPIMIPTTFCFFVVVVAIMSVVSLLAISSVYVPAPPTIVPALLDSNNIATWLLLLLLTYC